MATLNYNWQLIGETSGTLNGNTCNLRIYAKINSQNIANNSSSVSYQSRLYYGGGYFETGSPSTKSLNGSGANAQSNVNASGTYYNGETTLLTITGNVTHNDMGNASVSTTANANFGPWDYNKYVSVSASLPKIDRVAITNSITGDDIEQPFSVNYTKYIQEYKYKLRISIPFVTMLERIDYDTSDTQFTLTQEIIESLYARFTNTNTFDLGFAVETWDANEQNKISDGNEVVIKCKISGATPIFTDFDYNDINSTTLALTGNSKYNINGYSTIRVSISTLNKAVAQKGATMVKYQFMIGNDTREVPYSDNSEVYIDIPNASVGEYKVFAIDSRNNSTLVTKVASQIINYEPLYLNTSTCNVERSDGGVGENVTLTYNGNLWNNSFGSVSNSITLSKYEFKKVGEENWVTGLTNITPTISDNTLTFSGQVASNESGYTFAINDAYNFKITLQDKLSTVILELTPLPSGIPNISLNKNGVGIMCDYDETLGGLMQVGGQIFGPSNAKLVAIAETGSLSQSSGTFNLKNFSTVNILDNEFLKVESNVLKCKKQGYYRITLKVRFNDVSSGKSVFIGTSINDYTSTDEYGTWAHNNQRLTVTDTNIIDLNANDTIKIMHSGTGVSADAITRTKCWIEYVES